MLQENQPVGSIVGQLSAIDTDGDLLRYSITEDNDYFTIDVNTGEIRSQRVFDFERLSIQQRSKGFNFKVKVQDFGGYLDFDEAFVHVQITDEVEAPPSPSELIPITTLRQLNAMRYDLNGDGIVDDGANIDRYNGAGAPFTVPQTTCSGTCKGYKLMNDLDFENGSVLPAEFSIWAEGSTAPNAEAKGWTPIGTSSDPYTAIFHGGGHTIDNLYIGSSDADHQQIGLFGVIGVDALVRNLGLSNVSLDPLVAAGGQYSVGSLAGINQGIVLATYATGRIIATKSIQIAGGLIGKNIGLIKAAYTKVHIGPELGEVYTISFTHVFVGGLVGENSGDLVASYASGQVAVPEVTTVTFGGGLVGLSTGTVSHCYATNSVHQTHSNGMSTGPGPVAAAFLGVLVGRNQTGTITQSYFDSEASLISIGQYLDGPPQPTTTGIGVSEGIDTRGNSPSEDVLSKTTQELQMPTDYTGIYSDWDIDIDNELAEGIDNGSTTGDAANDGIWDLGSNADYPILRVDMNGDGTIDAGDNFGPQ